MALVEEVGYISPLFGPELKGNFPTVVIYGFSILEEVISKGIVPAFQKQWMERTGEEVRFYTSFAGSGTVMSQIRFGAQADRMETAPEGVDRCRQYVDLSEKYL